MLFARAYTHERGHHSATLLYPTRFSLNVPLPSGFAPSARLMVGVSPRALWLASFFRGIVCFGTRGEQIYCNINRRPLGPFVSITTITTVTGTNRVDSGRFSLRYAFRRTHTSADPIRLICIRLALPLTFSLLSRFAPRARLVVVGVSRRALRLAGHFPCDAISHILAHTHKPNGNGNGGEDPRTNTSLKMGTGTGVEKKTREEVEMWTGTRRETGREYKYGDEQ